MKYEDINPDYLAVTGSRLYGYAVETSDFDLRGFFLPPKEYLYGLSGLTVQQITGPGDSILYNLKDYLYLVAGGNTSLLEILFAPTTHIKAKSPVGDIILNNLNLLLSKTFYRTIRGYALSEFRKAKAIELRAVESCGKSKLFTELCSAFQMTGPDRDYLLGILQKFDSGFQPLTEVSIVDRLGERRRGEYAIAGYCTKNAAHCLRLLSQGVELLTTGRMTFPRSDAEFLKSIRMGTVQWDTIEGRYASLNKELDEVAALSQLPNRVDTAGINRMYLEIVDAYAK